MTLKLLSTLIIIFFTACNSGQNTITTRDSLIIEDTTKKIKQSVDKVDKNAKQNNSKKLIGLWTDGSSENASFEVRKDSIYYIDQFATYLYLFNGDTVKIIYPDWIFTGAVSFSKDTLLIISENGTTKYWKFAY